jgi:predicted aminopeptidase
MAKRLCLIVLMLVLSGCESVSYYSQAAKGQWDILVAREPLDEVIEHSADDALKKQLVLVTAMRRFAAQELGLPVGGAYSSYVDLKRDSVVWNVFAAPALSFKAKTWCFPIAGCIRYRGYFSEEQANRKAAELAAQGMDTYVGRVAAYSTLGWFDDPVLNTFVGRTESALASLLFHELAHRQLYVKGDTVFNESFARSLEIEAVKRWFVRQGDIEAFQHYLSREQAYQRLVVLLLNKRNQLADIYQSESTDEDKVALKEQVLAGVYADFERLNDSGELDRYGPWMKQPFNNARLITIASYNDWVPAFSVLLEQNKGDLKAFYNAAKALSLLDYDSRQRELQKLQGQSGVRLPN